MGRDTSKQKLIACGQFLLIGALYAADVVRYAVFVISAAIFLLSTAHTGYLDYKKYKEIQATKDNKRLNA